MTTLTMLAGMLECAAIVGLIAAFMLIPGNEGDAS